MLKDLLTIIEALTGTAGVVGLVYLYYLYTKLFEEPIKR